MELFLTSSVHAVAHDIAKKVNLAKGNKLVFITTPAEPKEIQEDDLSWFHDDHHALLEAGWDITDYTITGKQGEQIEQDIKDYDFIYVSGGHPAYMLEQSQKSGFIAVVQRLVREGKRYIGTSTGAILCGPTLPEWYIDEQIFADRGAYGFVNFTIAPHWGSPDFKEEYFENRLKRAFKEDQVPLLFLTDYQYVHVQDDQFSIVDVNK